MPQAMPRHGVLPAANPPVVVAPGFLGGMLAIALGTAPAALSDQRLGVFTVGDRVTSTLGDGDIWFCWPDGHRAGTTDPKLRQCDRRDADAGGRAAVDPAAVAPQLGTGTDPPPFGNAATFMATGAAGLNSPSAALLLIIASAAVLLGTETARFFRRDA